MLEVSIKMSQKTYQRSKLLIQVNNIARTEKFMIMDYLPCQCKIPIQI